MQNPDSRRRYPSDVSECQWRRLAPLLPPTAGRRPRRTDVREIVNGISYRWTTGCVWRMLPHDFPRWGTVYGYFRRWQHDGTLVRIRDVLIRRRRERGALRQAEATAQRNAPGAERMAEEVA